MREELFQATQDLSVPRDQVFTFFADPSNLQRLTPGWLHFQVQTPEPLPRGEGAVFEYKLRVRGLSLRWKTLIEAYEHGHRFVDRQVQGPYALWHHTHLFEDLPDGGTRITDRVRYRIGWGIFGRIAQAFWVQKDLEAIFAHRKQVISECFAAQG